MRTIQKKPLNQHHNRKRPSKVRLFKRFAKVEVFGDEPHLVDLDVSEDVSRHRWTVTGKEYAATRIDGRTVYLHRFVFGNIPDGLEIDHINQNPRDNRQSNLRTVTRSFNTQNSKARGRSCFKGVSRAKDVKKWRAQIQINGHHCCLGMFADEADAARAYDRAVIEHYGNNAFTNFPHRS